MARRKPSPTPAPAEHSSGITRHEPAAMDGSAQDLPGALARRARELGFCRLGITPLEPWPSAEERLTAWLDAGHGADLAYMREGRRADPRALLPGGRSLLSVALAYSVRDEPVPLRRAAGDAAPLTGSVARYARGADYHRVLKDKLLALGDELATLVGRAVLARACVDTAPLLEREAAARAGVGFHAKSTLLLVPGVGTNVLLGELLVDVALPASSAVEPGCGSCRACLDACPTGAFVSAHRLDARRCISYLTIEHEGAIPHDLRPAIGTRVFGCDVCQDVCPHNASATPRPAALELQTRPELGSVDLLTLLAHGAGDHRRFVRRSALRRAKRATLARNAAVALGNLRDARAVPALTRALAGDRSAVVRAHAAWALGRIGGGAVREALCQAGAGDPSAEVRAEAERALATAELDRAGGPEAPAGPA